jgi:hypothetical protein
MKDFNLEEYNKLCCDFIGTKVVGTTEYYIGYECVIDKNKAHLAPFDSDWNWIMIIIEKIHSINLEVKEYKVLEWFEVHLYSKGCLIKSGLNHADGKTKSPYYYSNSVWKSSVKEAVIQAIWEFLNWYKENKK